MSVTGGAVSVPVWFGYIRVESDGESVQIEDKLSAKTTGFQLPREGSVKLRVIAIDVNEQFVFVLLDGGILYCFELRTETLFRIESKSPADDSFSVREWNSVEVQLTRSEVDSPGVALKHQFDHWNALRGCKGVEKFKRLADISQENSDHFLVCTAFGAFVATNFGNSSVLERICDLRLGKNSKEATKFVLPFRIGKIAAGKDHLTILDSSTGEIWSYGTGTKGELGTGQVEADNWAEGPRRISSFPEAGIRCVDIESGAWHSLALTAEGDVYGWGWNGHGQLGQPSTEFAVQPTPFPFDVGDHRIIAICCIGNNSFLLLSEGKELAFGEICTDNQEKEGQSHEMERQNEQKEGQSQETERQNEEKEGQSHEIERQTDQKEGQGQEIERQNEEKEGQSHEIERQTDQKEGQSQEIERQTDQKEGQSQEIERQTDQKERQSQEIERQNEGKGEQSDDPSAKKLRQQRTLKVAVVGCSHGQLEAIYERMSQIEEEQSAKFDLLICCGDFQAIRNHGDLHHFHAPFHHRKLGTFYKYYSGEKIAPVLTLFVGGNHESSGFMAELPNGGWVAPNIFYMGHASVVRFAGLRIAGLSGIFKSGDFNRGHFERPPFHERSSIVSAYHVRSVDIYRLRHLKDGPPLDIFFSHDWPAGITDFGAWKTLLRIKPHFTEDVRNNRLGNPATMDLLYQLKPAHWFAAHLHVHFTAVVPHSSGASVTRFLALDKPNDNPRRRFIQFLHIPIAEDAPMELCYDPQWLAILRATDELTEFTDKNVFMPSAVSPPNLTDIDSLQNSFGFDLRIPTNFRHTAPPEREPWNCKGRQPSLYYRNPQTQQFCERLGIRDLNFMFAQASADCLGIPHFLSAMPPLEYQKNATDEPPKAVPNPEEIDLGEDEFGAEDFVVDIPQKESNDKHF